MPHATWIPEAHCAVAQSLAVLSDAWDFLIVRDVTRGHHRFDQLTAELHISRKVLADRLRKLEAHGLLERHSYQDRPVRHEYRLTEQGRALIPILVALQDWGDRWLLGDGTATGLGTPDSSHRVQELVGTRVPIVELSATTGGALDVVDPLADRTVLFGYPMASVSSTPDGWSTIPGAVGCTLENRLFRDRYPQYEAKKMAVRGVSTQRPDEQRAFAAAESVDFPLLSDSAGQLTAALRLPTFRAADIVRLRRFVLIIDRDRRIEAALYPIIDIPAAVDWALDM